MQMNVIATGCDQGLDAVLNRCWLLLQPAAVDVQLKGIGMAEAQLVASFSRRSSPLRSLARPKKPKRSRRGVVVFVSA